MTQMGFVPDWPAPDSIRACQSLRRGGVSAGPYASLNLALHVGDRAADVTENRRLFAVEWALPSEPHWLEQVHGTRIVDLDDDWEGAADGAVSGRPGVVCAVMTADCLPVLLTDAEGRRVAAVHAGWRGLAAGVLPAAVRAMDCDPAAVLAWLGPAIGPQAFEVGDEVREAFVAVDAEHGSAFVANDRGRWQADLYRLARRSLHVAGVDAVFGGGACTRAEADDYFSHRREAPCGRMATMIWLEPQ
jgi:hypothetical protein